jgi:hypothetical protein
MAATILAAVRGVVQKTLLGNAAGDAFNVYDQGIPETAVELMTPYAIVKDDGAKYIPTSENYAEVRHVTIEVVSDSQDNAEAMVLEAAAALTTTSYPVYAPAPSPTVPPFVVDNASLTYSKPDTGVVTNTSRLKESTGKFIKSAAITMRIRVTRVSA